MDENIEMDFPDVPLKRHGFGDGTPWNGKDPLSAKLASRPDPAPLSQHRRRRQCARRRWLMLDEKLSSQQLKAGDGSAVRLMDLADACQMALSADSIALLTLEVLRSLRK